MIVAFGVFISVVLQSLVLYFLVIRKKKPMNINDELYMKYEAQRDKMIEMYRTSAEKYEEMHTLLQVENSKLIDMLDIDGSDVEEDDDDDEQEPVHVPVAPIASEVVFNEPQPSRLFKKIEAARMLVHRSNIAPELKTSLVELLTPESDREAA